MNKYLKIFVFVLMFIFLASCGENPKETSIYDEYLIDDPDAEAYNVIFEFNDGSNFVDHIVRVPVGEYVARQNIPDRDGYEFVCWCTDKELENEYTFSEIVPGSMVLFGKWKIYEGPDFSNLLDEIPQNITSTIKLPTESKEYPTAQISWETSDPLTISLDGKIAQGRTDTPVTLTMIVQYNQRRTTYHKDVVVKPIEFDELRTNRIASGYYSHYNFTGEYKEDELKLDIIYVAFGYINPDCTINMNQVNGKHMDFMQARPHGVRVVLSLKDGGDQKNFSYAASTEENRKKFAAECLDIVERYHFDGIDVDWEYPGSAKPTSPKNCEAEVYTELMKEIHTALKGKNEDYLVTAAIPGGSEGFQRYNLPDVEPYMDLLNLMTYDLNASGYAYHHCALKANTGQGTMTVGGAIDSIEVFKNRQFPIEKIVMGIAFYGKINDIANNGPLNYNRETGAVQKTVCKPDPKTITYTNIYKSYINNTPEGVYLLWDSTCMADYIYDSRTHQFITYDGVKAIEYKCKYANGVKLPNNTTPEYPCAGVMVWDLGEDSTGNLISTLCKYMGH